jgi:hypothetical protein
MRKNRFSFKATPENTKGKFKLADPTKKVEFKKKKFEFKASSMEQKKGVFNQEISFANPNKSEMFLFVEKIYWDPSKTLLDGVIKISAAYPDGQSQKMYNSKIATQPAEGKRNINLTYSVKEGALIKVGFECRELGEESINYSLVYKWLDPQFGKA